MKVLMLMAPATHDDSEPEHNDQMFTTILTTQWNGESKHNEECTHSLLQCNTMKDAHIHSYNVTQW